MRYKTLITFKIVQVYLQGGRVVPSESEEANVASVLVLPLPADNSGASDVALPDVKVRSAAEAVDRGPQTADPPGENAALRITTEGKVVSRDGEKEGHSADSAT